MLGPDLSYCTLTWDKTAIPMDGYYFIGDFNMRDTASLVFTADTIFRVRFISYDGQITSDINNPVTNEFLKNAYEKIRLYPNPTKDNVTVYFDEFLNYDWQLSIRTLNGKLLFLEEYRDRNQNKTIGVRNLPCGIYIFSISINNCVINKKLIIGL